MSDRVNKQPDKWVEGIDYIIEDEEPTGPPCPVCNSPQEEDYQGKLFCAHCIAEYYDRYAKQDTNLNMRINSNLLEDLKITARRQGEENYQRFIRRILMDAVKRQKVS